MRKTRLSITSIERLVPTEVLPAYEWSEPRWLDVQLWPAPGQTGLDREAPLTADNPPRMLFVLRQPNPLALPTEAGVLHLPGLPADSQVVAPWAIDHTTDALFEAKLAAEELLELATDSLRGVFWGLHDWAHFHSHGPFERIAETELQCDVAALCWLWDNHETLAVTQAELSTLADAVFALWQTRLAAEHRTLDLGRPLQYLAQRTPLRCPPTGTASTS